MIVISVPCSIRCLWLHWLLLLSLCRKLAYQVMLIMTDLRLHFIFIQDGLSRFALLVYFKLVHLISEVIYAGHWDPLGHTALAY